MQARSICVGARSLQHIHLCASLPAISPCTPRTCHCQAGRSCRAGGGGSRADLGGCEHGHRSGALPLPLRTTPGLPPRAVSRTDYSLAASGGAVLALALGVGVQGRESARLADRGDGVPAVQFGPQRRVRNGAGLSQAKACRPRWRRMRRSRARRAAQSQPWWGLKALAAAACLSGR